MTKAQAMRLNPLHWAYIGDTVYDMFVRSHLLCTTDFTVRFMHSRAIKLVSAKAQAQALERITPLLSEDESDIIRRGRGAARHAPPKNQSAHDYSLATAFEALLGYLYLTGQAQRADELLSAATEIREADN